MVNVVSKIKVLYINKESGEQHFAIIFLELVELYDILNFGIYKFTNDTELDIENGLFAGNKIINLQEIIEEMSDDYNEMGSKVKVNPVA